MTRGRRLLLVVAFFASVPARAQNVTYDTDMKKIINDNCQGCHAKTPPMLGEFADAQALAAKMAERVALPAGDAKLMPKKKLDAATIKKFADWAAAGAPQNNGGSGGGKPPPSSSTTSTTTTMPPTTVPNTTPGNNNNNGKKPGGNGGVKPPGSNNGDPTPLVLDLEGHGDFHFAAHAVRFDIRADGKPVALRWPAAGTGFLAIDRNHNGAIDDGSELFGDAWREDGTRAADGFAALRALDANGDGVVDRRDAAFGQLVVWTDDNENGRTETGELKPLLAYGIDALALSFEAIPGLGSDGNAPKLLLGSYAAHGEVRILADIFLESF